MSELKMYGRDRIYTAADYIDENNVLKVLNEALNVHSRNVMEIDYLYWYRRGITPIRQRTKEVRPEINNMVNENHAEEIVAFKNGLFLTQDATYVARKDSAINKVAKLNEYLYRSGKHVADNTLTDWFHTVGKADLYVEPCEEPGVPYRAYALDPRSAGVVYSLRPGNRPVFCFNMVISNERTLFDLFTEEAVFRLEGTCKADPATGTDYQLASGKIFNASHIISIEPNIMHELPIVEYYYSNTNMGAFESVLSIMDAIEKIQSNRIDGIEQFIQSLCVAINCNFEDGVTANSIRQAGMIALNSKGENKADFRILSEQLDQSQTQVLVDYLYDQMLTICAMPTTTKGGASTSDTGAAVELRDGWTQALCCARNTEDMFKQSNYWFDRVMLKILKMKGILSVDINDFELRFVRNDTQNLQSKAQALGTLMSCGMHPLLAFQKCGISSDPVNDYNMSKPYIDMKVGNPEEKKEEVTDGEQKPPADGRDKQDADEPSGEADNTGTDRQEGT